MRQLVLYVCAVVFLAAAQAVFGDELLVKAATGHRESMNVPHAFAVGTVEYANAETTTTPQAVWLSQSMSLRVTCFFSIDGRVSQRVDRLTLQLEEERSPYVPVPEDWQKFKLLKQGTEVLVPLQANREGHLSFLFGEILTLSQHDDYQTILQQKYPGLYQQFMWQVWLSRLHLGGVCLIMCGGGLWMAYLRRSRRQGLKQ